MSQSIAAINNTPSPLVTTGGAPVRTQGGAAVGAGFDAALAQTQKLSAPVDLLAEKKKDEVKIARSYRMESAAETTNVNDGEAMGVDDFIDLINPLQHIPVVGSVYRALTGDEIRPEVKVAGSFLLGAATGGVVLGAMAGIASAAFEETTGQEPMIELAQNLFGDDEAGPVNLEEKTIKVAAAAPQEKPVLAPDAAPLVPVKIENVEVTPVALAKPESPTEQPTAVAAAPRAPAETEVPATTKAMLAAPGNVRVGNVIYTSPRMKSAARALPEMTAASTDAAPAPSAQAKGTLDSQTLGAMIHQQAKTRESGNSLPPELVQDMMIMALDKYKAAQADMGSTAAVP